MSIAQIAAHPQSKNKAVIIEGATSSAPRRKVRTNGKKRRQYKFTLRLSSEEFSRLKLISKYSGRSQSEILRDVLVNVELGKPA